MGAKFFTDKNDDRFFSVIPLHPEPVIKENVIIPKDFKKCWKYQNNSSKGGIIRPVSEPTPKPKPEITLEDLLRMKRDRLEDYVINLICNGEFIFTDNDDKTLDIVIAIKQDKLIRDIKIEFVDADTFREVRFK